MNKTASILLSVLLLLSLCACGTDQYSTPISSTTSPAPSQFKISESTAVEHAKEYMSITGYQQLAKKAGCYSVKLVKIGSTSCTYNENSSEYTVTLKGTFWEVDEYGKSGHLYDYSMVYTVNDYNGFVYDKSCTVSRSYE